MANTPTIFYNATIGKSYDVDGVPRNDPIQCVDYFKYACKYNGIAPWACGGDGYADNIWYNRAAHAKDFDFITGYQNFKDGDFVIWPNRKRNANTPYSLSHIAMYYQGDMVGQNQTVDKNTIAGNKKKGVTRKKVSTSIWSRALGAMRFKCWEGVTTNTMIKLEAGKLISTTYDGASIYLYCQPIGTKLTMLSAKANDKVTDTARQLVKDIDRNDIWVYGKINANYFDAKSGQHLGVRCGLDEWAVPRQGAFYTYVVYDNADQSSAVMADNDFWLASDQCQMACSPGVVLMEQGQVIDNAWRYSNAARGTKNGATVETMLIRANGMFAMGISRGRLTLDQYLAFGKTIEGVQDIILMDGGGSSQLVVKGTPYYATSEKRPVANCLAFYKPMDKSEPESKDQQSEDKNTEEDKPEDKNTAQITNLEAQVADLQKQLDTANNNYQALLATSSAVTKERDSYRQKLDEIKTIIER